MKTGFLVLAALLSAAAPSQAAQIVPVRLPSFVGVPTNAPAVHWPGAVPTGVKIQLPAPKVPIGPLTLLVKAAAPVQPAVEEVPSIEKIRGMFDGSKVAPETTVVAVPATTITFPEADLEKDIGLR